MCKVFGYARISTAKQSIDRQIAGIKAFAPNAEIYSEAYTGTKIDRPEFSKLLKRVKSGDTIVFDEISRMSRDADEGFTLYQKLYNDGVNLVFLKERALDTENLHQTQQIAFVGNQIADIYIEATNKVLMIMVQNQIRAAFAAAQHEVDFLHKRTADGMAAHHAGQKISEARTGKKVTTKLSISAKECIRKNSKSFGGSLDDADCMKLAGCSRNSFYKYKRELAAE